MNFQHESKKYRRRVSHFWGRKTLPISRVNSSLFRSAALGLWAGTCITHTASGYYINTCTHHDIYSVLQLHRCAAFCTTRSCWESSKWLSVTGCTYLVPNLSYSRNMRFQRYIGNRAKLTYTSHHLYLSRGVSRFTTYIPRFKSSSLFGWCISDLFSPFRRFS